MKHGSEQVEQRRRRPRSAEPALRVSAPRTGEEPQARAPQGLQEDSPAPTREELTLADRVQKQTKPPVQPRGSVRYSQMDIHDAPVLDRLADGLEAAGEDSAPLRHLSEVVRKEEEGESASPAPAKYPPQVFAAGKQPRIQKLFRETPDKVDRHLTLTSAEAKAWLYARRRITTDLDTGEPISDDQVVGMSSAHLHRPLDKPRRLKIEFHLVDEKAEARGPGENPPK